MKLRVATLIGGVSLVILAACANIFGPREVELPIAKLQESINRKFPANNRYLEVFDIAVSNPKIELQPETNRVVTTVDASIAPPFVSKTWKGSFTLSGVLAIDPVKHAVIMLEPRMDKIALDGVDSGFTQQMAKMGGLLAEQILKDAPLYTFKPEDFRVAGFSFSPSKITTKSSGLVVTFEPVK